MRQKMPTVFILMVMCLVGAAYWVDLCYYTDSKTGFVLQAPVWVRYLVLIVPMLMSVLGLRTVGPKAISVMRVKNAKLGGLFIVAAVVGVAFGIANTISALSSLSAYGIALGLLMVWYGAWMLLSGVQIITQNVASPTKSALLGMLAGLPYIITAVYRILANPSSLHRIGPLVRSVSAIILLIWFGMLLRSLYIALPRRRVQGLYFFGLITFMFSTCIELPYAIYTTVYGGEQVISLLESINMAVLGLVAGCVSVSVAGRSGATKKAKPTVAEE